MNPTSPRGELLERERRRLRPAGIAAVLSAVLIQGGLIVTGAAVDADSTAERLLEAATGSADGALLAGAAITAAGFVLAGLVLTFLFLAAAARSERVRRRLVALAIIGAVLVGAGIVVNHFAFLEGADDFAVTEPAREEVAFNELLSRAEAGEIERVTLYSEEETLDVEQTDGTGYEVPYPDRPEEAITRALEAEQVSVEDAGDDELSDAADERARDTIREASGARLSEYLVRGGALALAIGFFYTALWAMRTGLLTRFWGTFGMASAVVLALFFLYLFTLVWFIGVGLLLFGAWPGGRPPAWETGTAIPWPKPGERPRDPDAPLEGSGREVTEPPLPDPSADPAQPGAPTGRPRRKRKRR